jgi:hypothetical protein
MESEAPVPRTIVHPRNDVDAKQAFVDELVGQGFAAKVISSPADIKATKNGATYYFEIKKTSREDSYFGAATLTEWEAAIANPKHFYFVTAQVVGDSWIFHEYSPEEFMRFSTIPPFKVFFQIPVGTERAGAPELRRTRSIRLSADRVAEMSELFARWRAEGRAADGDV